MNRAQRAVELHDNGANCGQAIVCAFSDITGLSEEMSMKVCGTFGGGFEVLPGAAHLFAGRSAVRGLYWGFSIPMWRSGI